MNYNVQAEIDPSCPKLVLVMMLIISSESKQGHLNLHMSALRSRMLLTKLSLPSEGPFIIKTLELTPTIRLLLSCLVFLLLSLLLAILWVIFLCPRL